MRTKIRNGYTLTELLLVLGLLSAITGVAAMAIYQFYTVTSWGNAQLAVDADLRNAGLWLMRDGNQSVSFTPADTCGVFAAPTYTGPVSSTRYITYTWSANTLNRQDDSGTIGVARRVTGVQCPLSPVTGGIVAVTVTSASGNVSGSTTFTVTLRVD